MGHRGMTRRGFVVGTCAAGGLAVMGLSQSAAAAGNTTLRQGSRGGAVTSLQKRLNTLGYWCGAVDGVFGGNTTQAVLALQKVSGLSRDGIVGPATQGALNSGRRPSARHGGNRMEVDLGRQVALVVRGGRVQYILNTSTGSGQFFSYYGKRIKAVTPTGEFKIFRHGANGWDYGELGGLWRPYYFNGGIAFHGAAEVPAYPASHGCCRLSVAAQDFLIANKILYVGEPVSVY